jgi:hypothetical protein
MFQNFLSSYLHFALFGYEIEQGLNEGRRAEFFPAAAAAAAPPTHPSE